MQSGGRRWNTGCAGCKRKGDTTMEYVWKNKTEALSIQDIPCKKLQDACFRPIGLLERNCEYLSQHLCHVQADEETIQAVADISAASARLERSMGELFSLLELLQNNQELPRTAVDLCTLLQQVMVQADMVQEQLGVEILLDNGGMEHCVVSANCMAVETLCLHLLSNALHACQPGGTVRIELTRQADRCRLLVQDDGCGLPDNEERLLQNRRAFLGGGGMGLLLCGEYCRLMGWELQLEPALEQGTKAVVTIPLTETPPINKVELHAASELKSAQRRYRLRSMLVREMRTMPERMPTEE